MDQQERPHDFGPSWKQLTAMAWAFGLLALGCLVRLLAYTDDGEALRPSMLVWLLLGVMCAVYSAASAVLVGVKQAEQRLALPRPAGAADLTE